MKLRKARSEKVSQFSPELGESGSSRTSGERWRVILYNDNRHKFDEVVSWLQDTAGCASEFAIKICHVCQDQGRAVCFQGSKQACRQVTTTLRAHGLQVEVDDF